MVSSCVFLSFRVRELADHALDRLGVEPLKHGPHHVLTELGEPVHQRARERRQMEALGASVVRIEAALDHSVGTQPVDEARQGDRLQVEHFGEFGLLQALGMFQPGHHGPLGTGDAKPARALVGVGPQQAGYIIENERKFTTRVARAHYRPAFPRPTYDKLAYNIVNRLKRIAALHRPQLKPC